MSKTIKCDLCETEIQEGTGISITSDSGYVSIKNYQLLLHLNLK